jgi:hypothetical protein
MADVCHAAAPNKRDARSSSVIESQIEILSNSARRIERVAVDTKRRETDIVRPFLYGSVEPLIPFCEICAAKMDEVEHSRLLLRGEFIDRV